MNEINKTSLNIDGDFVKSFVRAVDRKINTNFLEAIDTAKAGDELGDITLTPAELIDQFIVSCELAAMRVQQVEEYQKTALLIMNPVDYANLYINAKKSSSDFALHNPMGMFYGASVITFEGDVVPSGRAYVIPWGTTGHARWTDNQASATYQELFDGMWCWAKKSGGDVVIEPGAIDVILTLPLVTAAAVATSQARNVLTNETILFSGTPSQTTVTTASATGEVLVDATPSQTTKK